MTQEPLFTAPSTLAAPLTWQDLEALLPPAAHPGSIALDLALRPFEVGREGGRTLYGAGALGVVLGTTGEHAQHKETAP